MKNSCGYLGSDSKSSRDATQHDAQPSILLWWEHRTSLAKTWMIASSVVNFEDRAPFHSHGYCVMWSLVGRKLDEDWQVGEGISKMKSGRRRRCRWSVFLDDCRPSLESSMRIGWQKMATKRRKRRRRGTVIQKRNYWAMR